MNWRHLSPEEARSHPRYGLAGWLYALFALIAFAVAADAAELYAHNQGSDRPRWLVGLTLALNAAVLTTGLRRWRHFPEFAIAALWLTGGLSLAFTQHMQATPNPADPLDPRTLNVAAYLTLSTLLTYALLTSERVNLTYKHRLRTKRDA